ncbi:Methylenetetrahydrofolate dehydrogenase [Rhizobium freirei PRF 81]|uniref:methenyltetrahydrofolate cyclohydrolase n=1 Tax=Rhizobium freirei PRF 81 TaxID=363754 RepID=N6U9X4_9HYPH|nr:Methylenetetrahydrofolate dehydrogenase [Rhizobium freirei PRF 81]
MKAAAAGLEKETGVKTGLAVVIVGDDPASHTYVGAKGRMAKECGFNSIQHTLPAETTQEALAGLVASLNDDPSIHGILVQLPLPKQLNSDAIIQSIRPDKDVDGLHVVNAGKLATGDLETGLISCTPAGAMLLVRQIHGEDLSGLNAVVIGRPTCSASRWRNCCSMPMPPSRRHIRARRIWHPWHVAPIFWWPPSAVPRW